MSPQATVDGDPWAAARAAMLAAIDEDFGATAAQTGLSAMPPAVRAAIAAVPRHRFVPEASRPLAYANRPLPIGHGQTISQPFIVALMTALLELRPQDRVLEIGSGCGYQAAVLAQLAARVHSVEIVPALAERAARTLAELGIATVTVHAGDGHRGWPEGAPYDKIIATAAASELPPAWIEQLAPGGRLVAPLGAAEGVQTLVLLRKDGAGRVQQDSRLAVRFVPLTGGGR
ncbi:MAG TPA: protein-L-isoaspartate(D-aspartate) O-methyltransferase [Rubrivivax sp.]|nr:protein-L-isoaspartate(D-aspartate) O-methyltransferase [Rubrivivax sp.]